MPRRARKRYTAAWDRLSLQVRAEAGYRCEVVEHGARCGRRATSADHVIPVDEAPHLLLDRSNVRATCAKHNQGRVMGRLSRMAKINRAPASVREW